MCWNRVPELRPEFPTIQKLLTEQIEDHGAQFMSEIIPISIPEIPVVPLTVDD